jgi:hypothetical protein
LTSFLSSLYPSVQVSAQFASSITARIKEGLSMNGCLRALLREFFLKKEEEWVGFKSEQILSAHPEITQAIDGNKNNFYKS